MLKLLQKSFISLLLTLSPLGVTSPPLQAAEEVLFSYGSLIVSVQVDSLAQFAETGIVSDDLKPYLSRSTPAAREEFRQALNKRVNTDPVLVSRFFNTAMGEAILERLGRGITIQGGGNGKYALRGALVSAALDKEEGLTLLNVLRKLPVNIQIQGELALGFAKELNLVLRQTEQLVQEMRTLTAQEAAATPTINYQALPDIRKPGRYAVQKEVWNLVDPSRSRSFYVNVYRPQVSGTGKIPVVIFSHGLASRPQDYETGLKHLASYGFLVAAPQHPGSDLIYLQDMFAGLHKDIFDVQDFLNRPKDISFVIDELERRNKDQFQGRLHLTNVGVAGHSFGGYTAIAVAGATFDFAHLQAECDRLYGGLNLSLLLQCRALELPRQAYDLRDKRVTAIMAGNPVNWSVFGKEGIAQLSLPVLLGSGSYDPAAPAVFEQTETFIYLPSTNKYWMMIEGQAHVNFTELDAGVKKAIDSMEHLTLPSQSLINNYVDALSLAFFQVYLQQDKTYAPYLKSAYAEYLSQGQEFKVDFVTSVSDPALTRGIEKNQW
jgi:predicted dienelactone hydrolase